MGPTGTLDAIQRRNFRTQSEYFTISNVIFNFSFLSLVLYEILGWSQIYIRGAAPPGCPLAERFLYLKGVLWHI